MHTTLSLLNHVLPTVSAASTGNSKSGSGSLGVLFIPILLFAVVYFVFLRPARNRQRASAQQKRQAAVGDEVTTTAGLIATVVAVEDDVLTLEIAPGVHCRYLPAAVLRVNNEDEDEPEDEDDATSEASGDGLDRSTHEVIDQPNSAELGAGPTLGSPAETTSDEPAVTPLDSTDGKPETPGGAPAS